MLNVGEVSVYVEEIHSVSGFRATHSFTSDRLNFSSVTAEIQLLAGNRQCLEGKKTKQKNLEKVQLCLT